MNIHQFLFNYAATTDSFKLISKEYKLEVLESGIIDNKFKRLVLIHVANMPVMFGLSATNLHNHHFLHILKNAHTTPIGSVLFAPESNIRRYKMQVESIDITSITNTIIKQYMTDNAITSNIYYRYSDFVFQQERMHLQEYILPNLLTLLTTH